MRRAALYCCLVLALGGVGRAADRGSFTLALSLYRAHRFSEARACFQRLAALDPGSVDLAFYLGRLALWFDDVSEARSRLEAAVLVAADDPRVQNALGDTYGLMAQRAPLLMKPHWALKSRAAYERAVALAPADPKYRLSLLGYELVAPSIVGGGLDRAQREAAKIAALDDLSGRIARADIDLTAGHPTAAFAEFDAVLCRRPDDYGALYQVGRCAALTGEDVERGRAALQRCLELAPPPTPDAPTAANVHYRLGDICARLGDRAGADREHALARQLEPDFNPAKMRLRY